MKLTKVIHILAIISLMISGCAQHAKIRNSMMQNPELQRLADWMTGSFSSAQQAETDEDYFDIRLHMTRIWKDRCDGFWIYVEQAVAGMPPYRQRVYRVTQLAPTHFESKVYSLDEPEQYAGAWKDKDPLSTLSPEKLTDRTGCEIILKLKNSSSFVGTTIAQECESNLRGAVYATSEVNITREKLISWDRGYDASGEQVWGAVKGGYIFDKLENYPL